MARLAGGFLLLAALSAAPAFAKQGMVVVKDQKHTTYVGDVNEDATPGKVDITNKELGKVSISKSYVAQVKYFDTPREELDARLSVLAPTDVRGRVALAQFAYDNKMYEQARDIAKSAVVLDASNRQAQDLVQKSEEQVKAAHPPEPPPQPAVAAPATKPAHRPGDVAAKRRLTNEELNLVRQTEWRPEDPVNVQLAPELKREAIRSGLSQQSDSAAQVGWDIVHKSPPAVRAEWSKGVKLNADPSSLTSYKKDVQRFVIASCASAECHNTDKGGNLRLFTDPKDDVTAVTDYVILQEYTKTFGGHEYAMIDRLVPEESLLVQFSLPPDQAKVTHPKAAGYTPPSKVKEVQIKQIENWIKSLPAVPPDYEIDLSKEPKKDAAKPAAPGAAPGAAAPGAAGANAVPATATPQATPQRTQAAATPRPRP